MHAKSLADAFWQLVMIREFAVGVVASLVAAFLIAAWQGWARLILVAMWSWVLSIKAEAEARPKSVRLKHSFLIQSGDRRQTYWLKTVPSAAPPFYDVVAQIHITSLDDGTQISKVILRYRRGWRMLIPAKRERDISLTNTLGPSPISWEVLPNNQMIYGRCQWRFPAALQLCEPETLKARVSLIDHLGRESRSGWFSIYSMSDPNRPS